MGESELFEMQVNQKRLVEDNVMQMSLKSKSSGKFVVAIPNGDVLANRGAIGPWEKFIVETVWKKQHILQPGLGQAKKSKFCH